jgi:hypothetical protein
LLDSRHRGVVNTVRQALAATGVERLHAVIGGFHLTPPLTDAYIRPPATTHAVLAYAPKNGGGRIPWPEPLHSTYSGGRMACNTTAGVNPKRL